MTGRGRAPASSLAGLVRELEKMHGKPEPPPSTDPFELVLWENVAYLVDDRRRAQVFRALRERVGLSPQKIAAAPFEALLACTSAGGMHPEDRAERLKDAARICLEEFGGDLARIASMPPPKAKKALMRFPGIGAPGAEKILLFAGAHRQLPLESNGLRVLLRVGYGREEKNYAASYRSVQSAVSGEIRADRAWLVRAHVLLRRHGQEICKRSLPRCEVCPLSEGCAHYARQA